MVEEGREASKKCGEARKKESKDMETGRMKRDWVGGNFVFVEQKTAYEVSECDWR